MKNYINILFYYNLTNRGYFLSGKILLSVELHHHKYEYKIRNTQDIYYNYKSFRNVVHLQILTDDIKFCIDTNSIQYVISYIQ